jgi:hypothetical protein
MPWDQQQRERIAAILDSRPIQSVQGKRCVLISERHRDALVRELKVDVHLSGDAFDLSRRCMVETKICLDAETVESRLCRLWRRLENWLRK